VKGKTIWIINQYAGSPLHGMEFRHYYLAKEFVKMGNTVFIISGSYSHLFKEQPKINGDFTFEKINGINYCWVKLPQYEKSISLARFKNMLKFMSMLKKLPLDKFEKPDSILVSSPSLFPIVRAKKWANKFHAKLIFEIRDIWPLTLQELGGISKWHPLIVFMKRYEKFAYKNADKIISVLPGAKNHVESFGNYSPKFDCVPNGIDLDEVQQPEPLESSVKEKLPANKFIVGYTGSIGVSNALDYFIRAAIQMKEKNNIAFVIFGNGAEKKKLMEMSTGCPNILFFDPVKKEQLQSLLKCFDVCYIGWKKEKLYRFGISANKLFDYMYSGKPIIHSVEAFNDPVKEAGAGISIEPENVPAISNAVLKIFEMNESERSEMGKNGLTHVLAHHSYKALAEKYMKSL
jgi:glycosyltransferase involved in cell wall biosynthesis